MIRRIVAILGISTVHRTMNTALPFTIKTYSSQSARALLAQKLELVGETAAECMNLPPTKSEREALMMKTAITNDEIAKVEVAIVTAR